MKSKVKRKKEYTVGGKMFFGTPEGKNLYYAESALRLFEYVYKRNKKVLCPQDSELMELGVRHLRRSTKAEFKRQNPPKK